MSPCKLFSNSATGAIIRRPLFLVHWPFSTLFMLWLFRFFSRWPLPVLHALTDIWNRNALGYATHAVMTYDQRLALLPAYLQQLVMESLGKSVRLDGSPVDVETVMGMLDHRHLEAKRGQARDQFFKQRRLAGAGPAGNAKNLHGADFTRSFKEHRRKSATVRPEIGRPAGRSPECSRSSPSPRA